MKGGRGGEVREGEGREKDGRGGEGKWRGLLIRGGTGGEKGRGRVPRLLRFPPGPRGARIVTGYRPLIYLYITINIIGHRRLIQSTHL